MCNKILQVKTGNVNIKNWIKLRSLTYARTGAQHFRCMPSNMVNGELVDSQGPVCSQGTLRASPNISFSWCLVSLVRLNDPPYWPTGYLVF